MRLTSGAVSTRRAVAIGLTVSALLFAACGNGEDRPGSSSGSVSGSASGSGSGTSDAPFEEGDATAKATVAARDFAFEGVPAQMKGEKVFFKVTNNGSMQHEFYVVGADGEPVFETHIEKGSSKDVAVELKAGSYTIECRIKTGNQTHADIGMKAPLTVT